MRWSDYVDLAAALAGNESESAKRSAISRAYYGAFNSARRRLEAHDISIPDHRSQSEVWREFRIADRAASGHRHEWQTVGELGVQLRQLRNKADYVDVFPELDRLAFGAVESAERILLLLDELEFS